VSRLWNRHRFSLTGCCLSSAASKPRLLSIAVDCRDIVHFGSLSLRLRRSLPSKLRILILLRSQHGLRRTGRFAAEDKIMRLKGVVDPDDVLSYPTTTFHGKRQQFLHLIGGRTAMRVQNLHQAGKRLLDTRLVAG
jgi:hypothetical protein